MTQKIQVRRWVLAAAVAGVVWVPGRATAQYRTGSDGHALDANNRAGSGGYNTQGQQGNPAAQPTGNDIVTKNVTGLTAFHGRLDYRDPFAFTGNVPVLPSQALEQISGASTTAGAPSLENQPRVFYRDSRDVAPPPGFQPAGPSGGYVAAPPPVRQPQDLRLGEVLNTPTFDLPRPGDMIGAGPVDPTAAVSPAIFSASPLYGLRELTLGPDGNTYLPASGPQGAQAGRGSRLSDDEILRLRRELNRNLVPSQNPNDATSDQGTQAGSPGTPGGAQPAPDAVTSSALPGAKPFNPALKNLNLATGAAIGSAQGTPAAGDVSTGQSSRTFLTPLPPPTEQSPQYAELQRRLAQYQSAHPQSDEEANRLFQAQLRARRRYEQGGGGPLAPTTPDATATTPGLIGGGPVGRPLAPSRPPEAVAPVHVGPIGQDIRAPGLSDLVKAGEALAQKQKFREAIGKFQDARAVAPNNPLITMDLANSELGAGFYKEAEQDLRNAFLSDPALLMGQYDLKSLIGDDRLQVLIGDLKHIASTSNAPTPVFLLAYLSYNTGDTKKAVEYLDLAQTRAKGEDDLIHALRDHWAAPAEGTPATLPADLNK